MASKLVRIYTVLIGAVLVLGMTVPTASAATGPNPRTTIVHERTKLIHARSKNPQDYFECNVVTEVSKSKAYPGYMQAYAHVKSCEGDPYPSECAATAELEIDLPKQGWVNDGEGPTEYGCPGKGSLRTNKCARTGVVYSYRTRGIYVIIWDGQTFDEAKYSPIERAVRIC
jgi:hypothetical protein